MKELKPKPWTYSLLIVGIILLVALLVWLDNNYEHMGEIFREANLPLLWKQQ